MFSRLSLLALIGTATVAAETKTPSQKAYVPKKVTSFDVCAPFAQYLGGPNYDGTGALTAPLYGGGCPAGDVNDTPVGFFTSICTANPYGGRAFTYYRDSTGGAEAQDILYLQNSAINATATNAYQTDTTFPTIPAGTNAGTVQAFADAWCTGVDGPTAGNPLSDEIFACRGEFELRGDSPRNKYPGSALVFGYSATTTYSYVGSTYTAETQYAIGGNKGDYVNAFYFNAYTVYTSITCQWAPDKITTTDGLPFTGSGKFEKSPSKIVKKVQQTIERRDSHAVVYNPYNWYQNSPINYYSEFTLGYVKPSSPLSML